MEWDRLGEKMSEKVGQDNRVVRTYTLKRRVKTAINIELSVLTVKQQLGLTSGMPFADDPTATLQDVDIDREFTKPPHQTWLVDLIFSNDGVIPSNPSNPDPTQDRVKRRKAYREVQRFITKDRQNNLILNAAGQPFAGGIAVTDHYPIFIYEWCRLVPTASAYVGSINKNAFNGWDAGKLLCLIESEECYEGAFQFWRETIQMIADPLGWPNPVINAGVKQLVNNQLVRVTDDSNEESQEPRALYGKDWDAYRKKGRQITTADAIAGGYFDWVNIDYCVPMPFEKIGVQQFPY